MSKMKCKRLCVMLTLSLLLACMMGTTAFAAGTGDVAGAVESTWATARGIIFHQLIAASESEILRSFYRTSRLHLVLFHNMGSIAFSYSRSLLMYLLVKILLCFCLYCITYISNITVQILTYTKQD